LISKKENQLTFAGARRPLTIIDSGTLRHVSATRRGIGEHYLTTDLPFEGVTMDIKPDTTFYMYTDGMQDQFGGPNAKKLMRKELCSWFMELESISIDLRQEWLQTRLLEWKGIQPQIDDICIVGFRV
jgi:serine phosphatase RsbU (regulator of sigma subunit)